MNTKTVYFLIDCSGSMYGKRGDAVNLAMEKVVKEVVPQIIDQKNADLNINFKVLGFQYANSIKVIVDTVPVERFTSWSRLSAESFDGGTPTGAALKAVIDDIQGESHGDYDPDALPPAIILISDGLPNGTNPTYEEVLECAEKGNPKEVKLFRKALRVAIGMNVGDDGRESLKRFGKLSKKMEKGGLASYYDCSDEYVDNFVEILKSVTLNVSITDGLNIDI